MSNAVRTIRKMNNNQRRKFPVECSALCGRPILGPPYVYARATGNRKRGKIYHTGCYPRDSRPKSHLQAAV